MKVLLFPKAAKVLEKLDRQTKENVKDKLKKLKNTPELGKHLKYCNFWSLRIGDYRAIYEIDKQEKRILVLFIGHRKDVYDDFSKLF